MIVVFETLWLGTCIDDPAVAVHGFCGVWGTLAVALFAAGGFSLSHLGIRPSAFAWTFPVSYGPFKMLDLTMGLQISGVGESVGLGIHDARHGRFPRASVHGRRGRGAVGRLGEAQIEATPAL